MISGAHTHPLPIPDSVAWEARILEEHAKHLREYAQFGFCFAADFETCPLCSPRPAPPVVRYSLPFHSEGLT